MCTAKSTEENIFSVIIDIEAALLDMNVCNDEFELLISKNDKQRPNVISICSPSQAISGIYTSNVRDVTILFKRKLETNSSQSCNVGLGIKGKFRDVKTF